MKKGKSKEAYYERLNELALSKKPQINESTSGLGTLLGYERSADGVAYGIVKENHKYYIKKGGLKEEPNISDFAYIGGLANITEYQYPSVGEAEKQRNFLFQTINEAYTVKADNKGNKLVTESAEPVAEETEVAENAEPVAETEGVEEGAKEEIGQAEKKIADLDAATAAAEEPAAPAPDAPIDLPPEDPTAEPVGAVPDMTVPIPDAPEGDPDATEEIPAAPELGGEPELGGSEVPAEPELGGDEVPAEPEAELGGDEVPAEPVGDEDENDEIKVHIGKAGQKAMSSDLDNEQVENYIEEFLGYFKKKLATQFDPKERRDLAEKVIINVEQEKSDAEADLESSDVVPNEEPSLDMAAESESCAECGGFGKYAENRGYSMEGAMEADDDELGNLVSGYANAHADGQNDGDFKLVALLVNPEVIDSLKNEYGHDEYADQLEPLSQEMNESEVIAQIAELWNPDGLPVGSVEAQPNVVQEQEELPVEIEPEAGEEEASMGTELSGGAQSLGAAVVKPDGAEPEIEEVEGSEAKVEIKGETVNVTVNEGMSLKVSKEEMPTETENKLRNYIRSRLQEKMGTGETTVINESESVKSTVLKKLDTLIDKQFNLFESTVKKGEKVDK